MTTNELLKQYLSMALIKVDKIFISKSFLKEHKNQNNLNHVKNKIYFDGIELKTI